MPYSNFDKVAAENGFAVGKAGAEVSTQSAIPTITDAATGAQIAEAVNAIIGVLKTFKFTD